eukprot:TRINITY_DN25164_c5_g1_i1.p1 TRINITY_DN25164_c5_g1~~TRINITY_DN25164_c5_g1_i1.p1  ORF type:complete len:176 (-),score=13.53 TRINITY_DN25164_c5_g1_i1:191-718(-)
METIHFKIKTIDKKYRLLFLSRASLLVGCSVTAEDVVQEAYLSALKWLQKKNGSVRNEEELKTMILRCISLRAKDELAQRKKNAFLVSTSMAMDNGEERIFKIVDQLTEDRPNDRLDLLNRIIKKVKLSEMEALFLEHWLHGASIAEIASELGFENRQITNCKFKLISKLKKIYC